MNAYEGNPEPELPFHLRSVGAQTSAELLTGSYNLENPFYKNDKEFEKGQKTKHKIILSTMETVGEGSKITGGTITLDK